MTITVVIFDFDLDNLSIILYVLGEIKW